MGNIGHSVKHGSRSRQIKSVLILLAALFSTYSCSWFSSAPVEEGPSDPPPMEIVADPTPIPVPTASDYSKFTHTNQAHDALPCLICHTLDEGAAKVRFPGGDGHLPCAGCHAVEFNNPQSSMCTICHKEPGTGILKSFPPLKSFNARFDHGRHLRQTNCATCHQPSRRGVALSIPSGTSAHATCFSCHGPQATSGEINIGSCNTCHQPGRPPVTSDWAKSFNFGFSHAEHRRGNMNCTTCHTILAGGARGRQVTSPVAVMHFASGRSQSCGNCHNDKKAFGTENFTNCKRCHEGSSFKF